MTLNGAALQLANAPSIQAGSNVESYRQKDGSVIFLAKATPVTPPGGTNKTPPGVTLADDAAFVGKGFAAPIVIAGLDAGALVAGTGAVVVGTLSGHFGDIPDMLHDVGDVTVRGYDWVSSWF